MKVLTGVYNFSKKIFGFMMRFMQDMKMMKYIRNTNIMQTTKLYAVYSENKLRIRRYNWLM
jgi:hypothetical protein